MDDTDNQYWNTREGQDDTLDALLKGSNVFIATPTGTFVCDARAILAMISAERMGDHTLTTEEK